MGRTQILVILTILNSGPSRPSLKNSNLIEDEDSVIIRRNTPSSALIYIEVRITTTKINTPDEYYGDRRKLKAFLI